MVLWCKAHIRNWVQDIQVGVPNELVIGGPIITKTVDLNSGSKTNHSIKLICLLDSALSSWQEVRVAT